MREALNPGMVFLRSGGLKCSFYVIKFYMDFRKVLPGRDSFKGGLLIECLRYWDLRKKKRKRLKLFKRGKNTHDGHS